MERRSAETGRKTMDWKKRVLGGMLILAYLASQGHPRLRSVVALAAATDFSTSRRRSVHVLVKMRWLLNLYHIYPLSFLARSVGPLMPSVSNGMMGVFNRPNMDPGVARKVLALSGEPIASKRIWGDFGRFVESGVFGITRFPWGLIINTASPSFGDL